VNVRSQAAMDVLQHEFPGLSLHAIPGDALAQWLKLSHYPVWIDHGEAGP